MVTCFLRRTHLDLGMYIMSSIYLIGRRATFQDRIVEVSRCCFILVYISSIFGVLRWVWLSIYPDVF